MRRSEFDRAVAEEFGAQAGHLLADLSLTACGGLSAGAALDAGAPVKDVWLALCEEMGVPSERRYGVGRLEPRRH
ncbi:DUF3046 domain-containing protein [Microbacterium sp. SORGH_AS_0888]|uniref:DUF3046 domain-containing protein n=1 Tax=Microbacterium sp. SORGH_AS_0888 TaxID=3041791 RepID=UPI00278452AB|nr:DUF3046 domain-containing protein [Microbacterium sp. SORGH_AS_0888]MDQ1129084.1 hypothetical protein [Microbacterium sp. SORGH_AS_0888]